MDQRVMYDRFTHGGFNRRAFLDRLAEIVGSSAAALALLPLLQNDYARAATVAPDDARLTLNADKTAHRIAAAVPLLQRHEGSTGAAGAVGFCWGGGMVNRLAVLSPDLKASSVKKPI